MHAIGSFILALIVIAGSAAAFAAIGGITLSMINDIVKKGSDANLDKIPAALAGLVGGAVVGGGIALKLSFSLAAGAVLTSMLGYGVVAVILAVVAVTVAKKYVRS